MSGLQRHRFVGSQILRPVPRHPKLPDVRRVGKIAPNAFGQSERAELKPGFIILMTAGARLMRCAADQPGAENASQAPAGAKLLSI